MLVVHITLQDFNGNIVPLKRVQKALRRHGNNERVCAYRS